MNVAQTGVELDLKSEAGKAPLAGLIKAARKCWWRLPATACGQGWASRAELG